MSDYELSSASPARPSRLHPAVSVQPAFSGPRVRDCHGVTTGIATSTSVVPTSTGRPREWAQATSTFAGYA